jgi:arylsulfatase A-like enzyme
VDAEIGKLLAALDALGLAADTLVLYTSDHGEMIGARELVGKLCFYDAAWRVPLLIAHPRLAPAGRAVTGLADLVDLFPTAAEAAGLPPPPGRHGVSLWPLLRGDAAAVRDHVFAELHLPWASRPYYGVRTERWKLARYEPGEEQLFDLVNDPDERTNLIAQAPERAGELQGLIERDRVLS